MAAESQLETDCREYIEVLYSGQLIKLQAPGNNGFPDRLVLIPSCPPIFTEFKSDIGELHGRQPWWRRWFINNGFYWYLANDFHEFCKVIDKHARRFGECG